MATIYNVSSSELLDLYINQKLSTYKIAKIFDCDPKTVYAWLKKYKIKTRPVKKQDISKQKLIDLYDKQKMSLRNIGKIYNMTPSGILKRVRKNEIKTRTTWDINTGHKKVFRGNKEEKAYLIGFRIGDLGVRLSSKRTKLIIVGSNTTKKDQIKLMKSLFEKYSKVWVSRPNQSGVMSFSTILHPSFSFLLPKQDNIESWIINDGTFMISFVAGYIDAEGSFGVYNKRGKFRVGSYDKEILKQIDVWLKKNQMKSILELERLKKVGQNKDFWRITINDSKSLYILHKMIYSNLRHRKRRSDFGKVMKNITSRLKNGTIHL